MSTRFVRRCPVCNEDNIILIEQDLTKAELYAVDTGVELHIILHKTPYEQREMIANGIHEECRRYVEDQ